MRRSRGCRATRCRLHLCWGNYAGPHHHDIELKDIIAPVLKTQAGFIYPEAANPRHEHEWEVWESVKIPDGIGLIPGVIDTLTNHVEHPRLVAQRLETLRQHRRQGERDRRHRLRLRHLRRVVGLRSAGRLAQARGAGRGRADRERSSLEALTVSGSNDASQAGNAARMAMNKPGGTRHERRQRHFGSGISGSDRGRRPGRPVDRDVSRPARDSSLAVERLAAGSPLPRAAFFHMRTLEMFRAAGIEDKVREQSAKEFEPEGAHRAHGHAVRQEARRHHPEPQRRRRRAQPLPAAVLHPARASSRSCARARREAGATVLDGHEVTGVDAGRPTAST